MFSFKKPRQEESQIEQGEEVSQHSQSSQFVRVRAAGRTHLCQICLNILAKYTCPKCTMKTCSLACIRRHKQTKNCNGQRKLTGYISKNQIDQNLIQKDYNFIEEMISNADKVKKVLTGVSSTINLEPKRFKIIRTNAKQMHNIKLSNSSNILERHRENISFFFVKTRSFYWVLELLYYRGYEKHHLDTGRYLTQPTSDQKNFVDALPGDYLDKALLEKRGINTFKKEEFLVFLQNKQNDQGDDVKKKQRSNSKLVQKMASGRFSLLYELIQYEMDKKICDQLKEVNIFEFPTLFVVHNSLKDEFIANYKLKFTNNQQNKKQKTNQKNCFERERQRQRSRNIKHQINSEKNQKIN